MELSKSHLEVLAWSGESQRQREQTQKVLLEGLIKTDKPNLPTALL